MRKSILLAPAILACTALPAAADWTASAGYLLASDSDVDADVGALYVSGGYRFELGDGLVFQPEVRLGYGITEDEVSGVDVEIDNFAGVTARIQYEFPQGAYIYAVPSYTQIELSASASLGGGASVTVDETTEEFGIGAGFGYYFNDNVGAELGYESIDETDVFTLAVRFRF
jgi:opacity protein-like surface antigen